MLQTRNKVQPRNLPRHHHIKNPLKNKLSLPQTSSSAKAVFEQVKLTHSHQIQDFHSNEFQLNIIPPSSLTNQIEPITKKFSSPQWILLSHMNSSYQTHQTETTSENPETANLHSQTSQKEYENSSENSRKTESHNANELMTVNQSEIQRILEMTVSDDKERQMNETNLKSMIRINDDLESKSAFLCQHNTEDSDKINLTSFDIRHVQNKSSIINKPKSAIIRPSENLQQFYKQELQMFSEYGLKPYEENRLRKIQQLQKMELLKEQADNIEANEAEENQEYFNRQKSKKTAGVMTKFRNCSAVVQKWAKERGSKEFSKKFLSKNKHSLSKGKKMLSPKLILKKA